MEKGSQLMVKPRNLAEFRCPIDKSELGLENGYAKSASGRRYPIVEGIPVFLVEDAKQTIGIARASLDRALGRQGAIDERAPDLHLESLGISEAEKSDLVASVNDGSSKIDPVVLQLLGATNGLAYKHLIGNRSLAVYPIPSIDLLPSTGQRLLDIGSGWGRWSIAATQLGYKTIGIDPSLGAVMAARRVAEELESSARFVVGDGRFLPFPDNSFDVVHSFSVLQHFSKPDAGAVLAETGRVLRPGGHARIQMPNAWGLRSLQNQVRRRFRTPQGFEVRFWSVPELRKAFTQHIGKTAISTHCYFGLGWLWCDYQYLQPRHKPILLASEALTRLSNWISPLRYLADSVWCVATKTNRSQDNA